MLPFHLSSSHAVAPAAPSHRCRLVLEAAGEALAAASSLHTVEASRTGVFVGISWTEYARLAADMGTGAELRG